METTSLKKSAVSGLFWRFLEGFLNQGISFIVSLILARLLLPEDYGAISLITVFITIANIFVYDGFCAALIQKKSADKLDYSSVLFGGFFLSAVIYLILYFLAPYVAQFYNMPILRPVLRVLSLRIPIAAIHSVQNAYLIKRFQFKKFFYVGFISTIASAVVGIYMAYSGYGVWALVGQNLFSYTINTKNL